jgi:hypothetical protein
MIIGVPCGVARERLGCRDRMGKKYGIWLGYTCSTMYEFHEHKHFQFGGSNDLGLSIFLVYV